MKVFAMSTVRHTHNYEAMLRFYQETLRMKPVQSWNKPGDRGTLLSPGEQVGTAVIEVIELGEEAVPGIKPINVVLSIEIDDVDDWHDQLVKAGVTIAQGHEGAPWDIAVLALMTQTVSAFGSTKIFVKNEIMRRCWSRESMANQKPDRIGILDHRATRSRPTQRAACT